ncbi:MAG: tetratricopeptide repeat protein [Thaumarchaeota archaeon]|nr:tetratricopeptide repeat protein [Nitrososphaerota archaeon]
MMEEAETWYKRGNEMMTQERSEEALTAYDKATALDPGHVSSWNNKGIALFRLKRFQEAIDCYDKALAINPDHANAWYNKAKALRGLGQTILDKANEDRVSAAKLINQSLAIFDSANECYNKGETISRRQV